MMRHLALMCMLLSSVASAQTSVRPALELQCASFGSGPTLECTARLKRAGEPLRNAKLTFSAHMPSMPMAHTIKSVSAIATGQPGEYRAALELEMHGLWAVQIDVSAPLRDRLVRRVRVEPCNATTHCPAQVMR